MSGGSGPPSTPPVLDLTDQPITRAAEGASPQPYSPDRHREALRGAIAMILLGLVVGIVVSFLIAVFRGWIDATGLEKLVALLLTPIITLFGTVLGFYFGERAGKQN